MKRTAAPLIGFIALLLSGPVFAVASYQHKTVLCAALDSRQPSALVLRKLGEEFCKQEDVRSVTDFPLVVQETFVKGRDDRVLILSRWYGLSVQRSYTFLCEWTDPDGKLSTRAQPLFEPLRISIRVCPSPTQPSSISERT